MGLGAVASAFSWYRHSLASVTILRITSTVPRRTLPPEQHCTLYRRRGVSTALRNALPPEQYCTP
eukprot:2820918-Rhodomonas_salina.1